MQYGTTIKQHRQAIDQLNAAGFKAWGVATGHHMLWVKASVFDGGCGRLSVPKVAAFIAKHTQVAQVPA